MTKWFGKSTHHRLMPSSGLKDVLLNEVSIEVDNHNQELTTQLKMIDLSAEDLRLIRSMQPVIVSNIDEIIDAFYATILEVTDLKEMITKHSTLDRLKGTLKAHIIEMFSGSINDAYIQKRLQIAEVHQRIGLEPKWYIGSFQNLQSTFLNIIYRYTLDGQQSLIYGRAITKLLNLEQQLVIEAYDKKNVEQKERYNKQVREEVKHNIGLVSQELAALTEQTNASTQQLIASSFQVNESFLHSANMAQSSRVLALTGSEKVNELECRIASIHNRSLLMGDSVKQLIESSEQIITIVRIVQNISGQTKILSLNASIEAARSGQHGAGFAVVAGEMRKLSEDSSKALKQINEFMEQSSTHTHEVVKLIEEVKHQVSLGQLESEQTRGMFNQILLSLESSLSEINTVETELEALVKVIEEVGSATLKVASSAEDLNVATQNF
ncbi:hypothetical protein GC093_33395 [Paenibacillus sp. LMG 31456]|uniref:Methyl-accepting transducer domain-containing protein n=1 Tax=Paenibacillus foliorum TaxID=2654974 RepID=A0A972GXS1_9BACL|nr:globin-coupled sensor protein [Paenibacillus foliorum]NOU98090.1 hypothetical protein [Paenibacillus foliorum]